MYKVLSIAFFFCISMPMLCFSQQQPNEITDTISQEQKDFELVLSASNGNADSVLYWLSLGANVNATADNGISALMYAAQNGSILTVKVLVVNGADINYHPYNEVSALATAVINNKIDIVNYLLYKNAKVDLLDLNRISPLMYAAAYGYYPITQLLLDYKADKSLKDSYGNDALMLSVLYDHPEITEFLLQSGANVNSVELKGFTPLLLASQNGLTWYFDMLKVYGADFSAKNNYDYNALDIAIINNQTESVNKLLSEDSLKSLMSGKPVKLAYLSGSREMIPVLKKNGCKSYYWPIFDKMSVGYGLDLNFKDLMFGWTLGLRESRYNLLISVSHFSRYWAKRTLLDYGNDIYFQFWERRSLLSFGLDKRIRFSGSGNKQTGLLLGLKESYTYGHYRGSEICPASQWMMVPNLGIYSEGKAGGISLSLEYADFGVEKLFPLRMNINTFLYIGFRKFSSIKKEPEW